MKDLKLSAFFKTKAFKTALVGMMIAPVIFYASNKQAKALEVSDLNPETSTVTSDDSITTTTEVSYEDEVIVNTEEEAEQRRKEYVNLQEQVKTYIESLSGEWNYEVTVDEMITQNEDILLNFEGTSEEFEAEVQRIIDSLPENTSVTKIEVETVTEQEEENLNETFDTEEEAEQVLEDFTTDIENRGGTVSNSEVNEVYVDSEIGETENAYTDLNEEEANLLKDQLEASGDGHNIIITATIRSYLHDTGANEEIIVNERFTTAEEAQAYLDSLVEQGYTITSSTISINTHEEDVALEQTCATYEEAQHLLDEFINNYNNASGSVSENRNENLDTVEDIEGTEVYETLEEARGIASSLNTETSSVIVVATVRSEVEDSTIESIISEPFVSEAAALAYLDTLRNQGYTIVDYNIEMSTVEYIPVLPEINYGTGTGNINASNRANMFIRLDGNVQYENGGTGYPNDYYVYAGSVGVSGDIVYDENANNYNNNLIYLINNNNLIAAEITVAISQVNVNNMLAEYGIALDNDQVIVWYVLKNQTDAAVQRIYTDLEGHQVVVNIPACSYHIDGVIKSRVAVENLYFLTGDLERDQYYVDQTVTTKGYDYNVSAEGTKTVLDDDYSLEAEAQKDIFETKYAIDLKTENKNYDYTVIANGVYDNVIGFRAILQNQTSTYKVATTGTGSYQSKSYIPRTGDDQNLLIYSSLAGASALGMIGTGISLTRKRKKEEE